MHSLLSSTPSLKERSLVLWQLWKFSMTRFVGLVEYGRLELVYTFAQSHAQSHWWFPLVLFHKDSDISWSGSITPYNNEVISQRIGPFFIVKALKLCTSAGYPAKQLCRLFITNSRGSITRSSLWRAVIDVSVCGREWRARAACAYVNKIH